MSLYVKKLSTKASLPTKGSVNAAGFDLYTAEDIIVPSGGRALVSTDIAVTVPAGTYGRIAPRSGNAVKYGIHVGAGVIDADYAGHVKVLLFNLGSKPFHIVWGDRIAQLILEQIHTTASVNEVDSLTDTARGIGGFGSTGR